MKSLTTKTKNHMKQFVGNQQLFMDVIERHRKKRGITVNELCKTIKSNPSSYYRWRKGDALISLEDAIIISRALDIDIEYNYVLTSK